MSGIKGSSFDMDVKTDNSLCKAFVKVFSGQWFFEKIQVYNFFSLMPLRTFPDL